MKKIYSALTKLNKGNDYWNDLSSGTTPKEFNSWATKHSNQIKKALKDEGINLFPAVSKGHFYYSMFAHSEEIGWIYLSVSDVRGGSYDDILIRSAKSDKDYTGGRNRWISTRDSESFERSFKSAIEGIKKENNPAPISSTLDEEKNMDKTISVEQKR